jgi:hypothetical protein
VECAVRASNVTSTHASYLADRHTNRHIRADFGAHTASDAMLARDVRSAGQRRVGGEANERFVECHTTCRCMC